MNKFESFPMLESVLSKLINKTEKTWGYFQIQQKDDNVYVLSILGSSENLLTFYHHPNHLYKLYWYSSSQEGVFVETKTTRVDQVKRTYKTLKTYQVCYANVSNPVISSINKMLAELIKDKINDELRSQVTSPDKKVPLVTVVAQY